LASLKLKSDIITLPYKVFQEWEKAKFMVPDADWTYDAGTLKALPYKDLDLEAPWLSFDIFHELTDAGIKRFALDWNALVA
jgi:transaldolase